MHAPDAESASHHQHAAAHQVCAAGKQGSGASAPRLPPAGPYKTPRHQGSATTFISIAGVHNAKYAQYLTADVLTCLTVEERDGTFMVLSFI